MAGMGSGLNLWRKLLGTPFVYDQIRPRVVGGIDMRPLYDLLTPPARRVVIDIGCGTGDALRYLDDFEKYLGVDTDEIAIQAARTRYAGRSNVSFWARTLEPDHFAELEPTGVVLSGVLHHMSNEVAESVLRAATQSPRLVRVVTSDIVFMPGMLFNNVMAMMDRGRFCRDPDAYAALARRAGLEVEQAMTMSSSPESDRVRYHVMALVPKPKNGAKP
jgi:SAM-dependent methyltransferase